MSGLVEVQGRASCGLLFFPEPIANPRTHLESKNPSRMQEPIVNPELNREFTGFFFVLTPSEAKALMPKDFMVLGQLVMPMQCYAHTVKCLADMAQCLLASNLL